MTLEHAIYGLLAIVCLHMAVFDLRHFRILDLHILAILVLACLIQFISPVRSTFAMIAGAIIGFALLEIARRAYRQWRGAEGLGFGDVKFLAVAGAWTGAAGLAYVMLIASISGLGVSVFSGRSTELGHRIAFGPHLAVGLVCCIFLQRQGQIPT